MSRSQKGALRLKMWQVEKEIIYNMLDRVSYQSVYRIKLIKFANPIHHILTVGCLHQICIVIGVQCKHVGTLYFSKRTSHVDKQKSGGYKSVSALRTWSNSSTCFWWSILMDAKLITPCSSVSEWLAYMYMYGLIDGKAKGYMRGVLRGKRWMEIMGCYFTCAQQTTF
jgi:hypothetical protein